MCLTNPKSLIIILNKKFPINILLIKDICKKKKKISPISFELSKSKSYNHLLVGLNFTNLFIKINKIALNSGVLLNSQIYDYSFQNH